jgi:RNA polymerase sigma-70 factor (ECF subfamily)
MGERRRASGTRRDRSPSFFRPVCNLLALAVLSNRMAGNRPWTIRSGDIGMLEPELAADSRSDVAGASCPDDDQLVALAKTHPQFYGDLYERYYGRILNYAYRRTLDVAIAEEITSNVFFNALGGLPNYEHRGKFGAWLYRIAGNEIRLNWRAKRRRPDDNANWRADYTRVRFAANRAATAEEIEEQAQQFAKLHEALCRLPERYQSVLALRYFEGLSYEEVADVLEKKIGSVKSLIHRGLERLRREL